MDELSDEVVVLPPVPLDPVFAEAVEDALAGEQVPSSAHDPNRVLGADPHDFAGLYIRHRSSFALHARRFLRDQRDVDEVVQEAFLRLFLALPELQSELQALAYCRRTITNLCIDRYRADQRRPRLVDLDSVSPDALPDDEVEDPVIQAEDAAIVRTALALLSPLHRDALVKREIEEKSLPVIAVELGVPEDSVKHLLHRARRALRRRLAETHLAPGVDLDDVSTLNLLARSAVHGGGRLGVLVVLFLGLALGASSNVPADAFNTINGLWADEPVPSPSPQLAPTVQSAPDDVPQTGGRLPGVFGEQRDHPGPAVLPPDPATPGKTPLGPERVPVVPPVPAATLTVDTSPSPAPSGAHRRPQPVGVAASAARPQRAHAGAGAVARAPRPAGRRLVVCPVCPSRARRRPPRRRRVPAGSRSATAARPPRPRPRAS